MPETLLTWPRHASPNRNRSTLSQGTNIKGHYVCEGILDFGGCIEGDLTADTLVIDHTGQVEGTIAARHLTIEGKVQGQIAAMNLTIKPTATVNAKISCQSLVIEFGADVSGTITKVVES